jgi:predicted DNA-binding transcriptional regulator AlpA
MKMLREPEVLARMGLGRSKFDEAYIKTGRTHWVRAPGERMKRLPESEVDRLIHEDIKAADERRREAARRDQQVPRRRSGATT